MNYTVPAGATYTSIGVGIANEITNNHPNLKAIDIGAVSYVGVVYMTSASGSPTYTPA